jgi:hypothetical protein
MEIRCAGDRVLDRAATSASAPALGASAVLPVPAATGLPAPMVAPAAVAGSAPTK